MSESEAGLPPSRLDETVDDGQAGRGRARGFSSSGARRVGGAPALSSYELALQALFEGESVEIPQELLDRWLATNTSPEALLAARTVGGNVEYLRRALELHPDQPQVLLAAIQMQDEPAVQRARLDRLKEVDPDNALGFYLSAGDHLAAGRTEQAMADLLAATAKPGFRDYAGEAMDQGRALLTALGRTDGEAALLGSSSVLLPHLAPLKKLAQGLQAQQQGFLASGDHAAAEAIASMGVQLAQRLESGQGSGLLINQLVGLAVENIVLSKLPPSSTPSFLEDSVADHLTARKARREELRGVHTGFEDWLRGASEPQVVEFYERLRAQGEESALNWMRSGTGPLPSP